MKSVIEQTAFIAHTSAPYDSNPRAGIDTSRKRAPSSQRRVAACDTNATKLGSLRESLDATQTYAGLARRSPKRDLTFPAMGKLSYGLVAGIGCAFLGCGGGAV